MTITFRPMTAGDLEAACAAHHSAILAINPGIYNKEMIEAWAGSLTSNRLAQCLDNPDILSLVAQQDENILGFMLLEKNNLLALYVHGAYQHQGVGQRFIVMAEEQARSLGYTTLVLRSAMPSCSFYERCGFRSTDDVVFSLESGVLLDCLMMEKPLTSTP